MISNVFTYSNANGFAAQGKIVCVDLMSNHFSTAIEYFALISNGIKDPLEVLELYRAKGLIEKAFGSLKERLNIRRQFVSSEDSLKGKLFVQFVAPYISHGYRKPCLIRTCINRTR